MIQTSNDVHQQFAGFFPEPRLRKYAYEVSQRLSEGHICLDLAETDTEAAVAELQGLAMVGNPGERQPFILHQERLYLERYFNYETAIIKRLGAFIQSSALKTAERAALLRQHSALIQELFLETADLSHLSAAEQTNWQFVAAVCAALNDFTIITGGPGTGKTTTVAKLLAVLLTIQPQTKVALAAPTGKASMRMAESLRQAQFKAAPAIMALFDKLEPSTVHRLLRYTPDSPYFRHNATYPLPYDVVIVDEASMLDAALLAKLLDAVAPDTRLILLGDKDQLASVEAGSMLGDLCQLDGAVNNFNAEVEALVNSFGAGLNPSQKIAAPLSGHIVELRRSRRFSSTEGIGLFSQAVINDNAGLLASLIAAKGNEKVHLDEDYDEAIFEEFALNYATYIAEPNTLKALQKLNEARILCAVKGGEQGVDRVNRKVEDFLRRKQLLTGAGDYYENRPIMITSNNYELGLFNGDIGILRPDEQGVVKAWFEDSGGLLRDLIPAYLPALVTVFAMTVHKSQGSEYDQVLLLLPKVANERLMTRELLYTAVTRAKQQVYIQGTGEAIAVMAATRVERASGIKERLNEI